MTRHFYERGWSGVNLEPIPRVFETLRAERPRDVNLNIGVSDRVGTLTLFEAAGVFTWSTSPSMLIDGFGPGRGTGSSSAVPVTTLLSSALSMSTGRSTS